MVRRALIEHDSSLQANSSTIWKLLSYIIGMICKMFRSELWMWMKMKKNTVSITVFNVNVVRSVGQVDGEKFDEINHINESWIK